MRKPEGKIFSLDEALSWRRQQKEVGNSVVVTNGCFDLIHRGHMEYLARARQYGDALLVAVNSDSSIRGIKGPSRPILPEEDRAYMLASLEAVDAVLLFSTPKATDLLRRLQPDVYVKGGDYKTETLVQEEYQLLKEMGCEIRLAPLVKGLSTTELIKRIRAADA